MTLGLIKRKGLKTLSNVFTIIAAVLLALSMLLGCGKTDEKNADKPPKMEAKKEQPDKPEKPKGQMRAEKKQQVDENAPQIVFDKTEHDFGEVEQNTELTHVFKFKNQGKSDLEIQDLTTGPGAQAELEGESVIPPGGEGGVKVTFDTETLRGRRSKSVRIVTNDPRENRMRLRVTASIMSDLEIRPRRIYFGRVDVDSKIEKDLKLIAREPEKVKIESLETSSEYITAELVEEEVDGEKRRSIRITLLEEAPIGRINEKLTVKTNIENMEEIIIPLQGRKLGDIQADPERIRFGDFTPDAGYEKTINIISKSGKDFEITSAESSDPNVTVDYSKSPEGGYDLTAKLKEDFAERFLRGFITIETNRDNQSKFKVHFQGYFRKNANKNRPQRSGRGANPQMDTAGGE